MHHIKLSESKANAIRSKLKHSGYSEHPKVMVVRYSKEYGNSVFIHHSLNIIRCRNNTDGSAILQEALGPPNGKVAESQDTGTYLSWFLNGYEGKSTTKLY